MSVQLQLPFFDAEGYLAYRLRQRLHAKVNDYYREKVQSFIQPHHVAGHPEYWRKGRFWVSAWRQMSFTWEQPVERKILLRTVLTFPPAA